MSKSGQFELFIPPISILILAHSPLVNAQVKPTNEKTELGDPVPAGGLRSTPRCPRSQLRRMTEKLQDWGDFVNRYTAHSSRHSSPEREVDFGDMRLTPSPISPVFSTADKQFCRRDNIDQCIAYLNQVCRWRELYLRFLFSCCGIAFSPYTLASLLLLLYAF